MNLPRVKLWLIFACFCGCSTPKPQPPTFPIQRAITAIHPAAEFLPSPCPMAPLGYDPYPEPLASLGLTNPVSFAMYPPPATEGGVVAHYLRFEHLGVAGRTYEFQYCHILGGPWFAYSRFTLTNSAMILNDHPVYDCEQARFFRIRSD